jgi:hypothetical protein
MEKVTSATRRLLVAAGKCFKLARQWLCGLVDRLIIGIRESSAGKAGGAQQVEQAVHRPGIGVHAVDADDEQVRSFSCGSGLLWSDLLCRRWGSSIARPYCRFARSVPRGSTARMPTLRTLTFARQLSVCIWDDRSGSRVLVRRRRVLERRAATADRAVQEH